MPKHREGLIKLAVDKGWTVIGDDAFGLNFERVVELPADAPMAKMAAAMGYQLKEEVRVSWTSTGAIHGGTLFTPGQQAAIDGRFTGAAAQAKAPKWADIQSWLLDEPWTPERS